MRRDIVRVVTPGTLTEDGLLEARGANRLAAVAVRAGQAAVASVELSTGEVECFALGREGAGLGVWRRWRPSEILVPDRLFADAAINAALKAAGGLVQPMAQALAEPAASEARLKRLYGVETLDGFGEPERRGGQRARADRRASGGDPGRPRAGALGPAPRRRGRRHGDRSGDPRQPGDRTRAVRRA